MQAKNGIEVELNAKNMFCMDNQAFCYLCAKQQKIELDEDSKNVYVEAWNKSRRATYQLIDYVFLIQPHSADETVALFNARRIVLGLVKPLALITKQIQVSFIYYCLSLQEYLLLFRRTLPEWSSRSRKFKNWPAMKSTSVRY